jgi:putative tricarboxylic transport membrane protein
LIEGTRFPKDVVMQIGPNFFPNILAILLIIFSIALLVTALLGRSIGEAEKFNLKDPRLQRAGLALILTILYSLLMKPLGFIIASVLYLFIFMFVLDKRQYVSMVAISCGLTALVYLIFEMFLHITLPLGPLNL